MSDKCKCSVLQNQIIFQESCTDKVSPDMLSLLLLRSHPIHKNTLSTCVLVPGTHRYFLASLGTVGYSSFLALHQSREFLSASKGTFDDSLVMFGGLKRENQRESKVEVKCWNVYSVWCQNDSDLDFSTSSEYRASTKPCRASSLFEILD